MKNLIVLLCIFCVYLSFAGTDKDDEFEKEYKKALKERKVKYENENPVFSQKGGMLIKGDHSFYFRTDDEWTGFSTVFLGYRYAVTEYFNIGIEGGASLLPHVYLANLLLHFKIYETPNKFFFMGLRGRFGYKYQDTLDSLIDKEKGFLQFGKDYLTIKNRHSIYFATDLTVAIRFGVLKEHCIYYSIFPKVDFDLFSTSIYVLFSPVMVGYEVRFGTNMEWSFAIESGYTFPIPWGSVPDGKWINFPSLANVGLHYRFGDKFYSKKTLEKIRKDLKK
ncbi:MAG: hypothetical protein A2086_13300 [Spirochaetes bacterium GWD1_27_9]|nr:MAG: hypothetical protein A2Z98_15205 [Spirochaetes bacterium GWB1_27_13]OHD27004.1 MAG: hypothetical protein A2Y34_07700 [Spirochaetes bacterium GWC1_27_15]OHD45673.1 MAG: hypothetical protein A2086_13300 [Spirochaetes bacterium GWD1_27_9]